MLLEANRSIKTARSIFSGWRENSGAFIRGNIAFECKCQGRLCGGGRGMHIIALKASSGVERNVSEHSVSSRHEKALGNRKTIGFWGFGGIIT